MKIENLEEAQRIKEHLYKINRIIELFKKTKKIQRDEMTGWWIQELDIEKSQRIINLLMEFRIEYSKRIEEL